MRAVVTFSATCHILMRELFAVDIGVTILALGRSSFEIHVLQPGFKIGRLMAIDAGRHAMGAQQGKLRLRVIESGNFLP